MLGSAAIKAVFLVEAALVLQRPAARVEVALLFIEPMLLVPIGPLALMLTPTILRRRRRRLAIHGSADPLQNITRALRVRRHRIHHKSQRKSQDRPLNHLTLPSGPIRKFRSIPALLYQTQ